MKCVIIIDTDLPLGIKANTSAALGITLASHINNLTGKKVTDANGNEYEGITNIPIPILALNKIELKLKHEEVQEKFSNEIRTFLFTDVAKKVHNYEEYIEKFKKTDYNDISILGMCLYGNKKTINKLTGNLKMLR